MNEDSLTDLETYLSERDRTRKIHWIQETTEMSLKIYGDEREAATEELVKRLFP